ncbi:MAG: hypothetical protein NWF03_08205 [Candidatus Bathyarchaeota archaeon]|nr:hypothetical protein [Candidatus Bathyarchaeota archaeon]
MNKKILMLISFLLLSVMVVGPVSAASCSLNLPAEKVYLTTVDLRYFASPVSFFVSTLSGVPAGYDVDNTDYLGWCIDLSHMDIPSDTLTVKLISSCNIPSEYNTEEWYSEGWNYVNYILNNKPTVTDKDDVYDIQMAIWNFVDNVEGDGDHNPNRNPSADSLALIANAYANGATFVPGPGDIVAVICVPDEAEQITIIEVEIPEEGDEGLTPGFWKNHVDVWPTTTFENYEGETMSIDPATTTFSDVFNVTIRINVKKNDPDGILDPTLLEALAGKNGVNEDKDIYDALARHAVAALLNALHPDVNYPMSAGDIINQVHDAISNTDLTDAHPLKNTLDMYNNLGGGIDAHGNPI